MFCPNCAAQLPADARFCANCGKAMPDIQSTLDSIPLESPVTPEVPADPVKPQILQKKAKRPLLLCAVAVLALAAVWMLFFSKKTVYLVTYSENITHSGNLAKKTIMEYEYDDLGNILSYSNLSSFTDVYGSVNDYESGFVIGYEYTKDGLLESAEGETGGQDVEYVYSYNDDGILKKVEGTFDDGTHIKCSCDQNGRIVSVKTYDKQGKFTGKVSYEYDKSGELVEKTAESGSFFSQCVYEDKRMVEQTIKQDDRLVSRTVSEWDEAGRLTEQRIYNEEGEITGAFEIEYTFKGKKLMELVLTMRDGSGVLAEIVGETQWDGRNATIELTGELNDGEEIPDDTYIELEYDRHGNLLSMEFYADDELIMEQQNEYQKVRVPRDYEAFWSGDPIWMANG